jgi:DNA helicase IV
VLLEVDRHELGHGVALAGEDLRGRHASVAVISTIPFDDLDDDLVLLTPPEAKGLEFDAVVVVEPARFLAFGERGARLLYIALTRAVQELIVVHAEPLPEVLRAPLGVAVGDDVARWSGPPSAAS